ncbi:ribonuclease H-like domain-containing protein [Tanacetum coccineum]
MQRRLFQCPMNHLSTVFTHLDDEEKISDDTEVVLEEEEPTELVEDQGSGEKGEKEVSTIGAEHSTVIPEVSTAAENLVYIRRNAEKKNDKGKGIMTEPEPEKNTKKQLKQERLRHKETVRFQEQLNEEETQRIARDAEIARQLHEEINKAGQERVVAKDDQAHVIDWSDPAVLRYHAQLNRPYSVSEVKKNMVMYLKNQGGYKMNYIKGMKYEDIRPIFEKIWDQIQSFAPMDSEKEKGSEKKGSRKKSLARKRAGEKQSEESTKRQKIEDDIEKEELKAYLDLVPREEFAMEIESLGTKYPIVDWKTHVLTENFMYYQIIRADGGSKNYKIFSEMLDDFDRQDVMDLHRLVEERYATSRPEGYDLMLWGDLKILFQPDEEDEVWRHQHEYNLISWRLFDSCGIHILLMDNGIAIHMMIEKKYPLTQEMLSKMLSRKLEVDHENEMAFELLRTHSDPDPDLYLQYKMSGEEPAPQMTPVESPQMISTVKLPLLKKDEYTIWSMRMEQYLTNTDYDLWQIIMNGDEPVQTTKDENGVETEVPLKTAQAILARQKERKAKSILLLAIPDEYQLRFHTIKDAKSLWAAIKSRFSGNVESKKMQKNVLKQQFENFSVSDIKGLDKAYDKNKDGIDDLDIDDLMCNKLESMRNQFFLGGEPGEKNISRVSWKKCLASKKMGGLGIGSIFALNVGLLFKWIWSLSPWSGILSSVKALKHKGIDLCTSIRFWDETWCDWNYVLRRSERGGIESVQLSDLKHLISDVMLSDQNDSWNWSLDISKGFTVASVRSLIDSCILKVSPIATRWKRSNPIKVNIFLWRLLLNKLPTRVNLDRKSIDVHSLLCPICQEDVETVNHIFFSCEMATDLWSLLAKWWDLDIPFCASMEDWFLWLDTSSFSKKVRIFSKVWEGFSYGPFGVFVIGLFSPIPLPGRR